MKTYRYTIKFTVYEGLNNTPSTLIRDNSAMKEKIIRRLQTMEIFPISTPILQTDGTLLILVYCFYNLHQLHEQLRKGFHDKFSKSGTLYYAVA